MGRFLLSLATGALVVHGRDPAHPICNKDMRTYQAPYVATEYDRSKHMGHYYEVAFRDLYLPAPYCDCQHTYKIADTEDSYYEDFEQYAMGLGRMASVITMNSTGQTGVSAQAISWSKPNPPIPGINSIVFNTAIVAFKSVPGQQQYEWVLEFTCNHDDPPTLQALFPDGFVGINMYSKSGPKNQTNLDEMKAAAQELGLGWAMDDWGWGFHEVEHDPDTCGYHPPSVQEYACKRSVPVFGKKSCVPVRWGAGTNLSSCEADCGDAEVTTI